MPFISEDFSCAVLFTFTLPIWVLFLCKFSHICSLFSFCICWAIVINLSQFCYPKLSLDTGSILNFGEIDVSRFQYESEKVKVKSLSRGRLCDPMDCSLPRSSVHGLFQARVLEWVALSFSRRSSRPRDWTWVSCIVGRCFTIWATGNSSMKQERKVDP